MFCAIWYHLYNLKNMKSTHGGLLLLVKLQASATHHIYSKSFSFAVFLLRSHLLYLKVLGVTCEGAFFSKVVDPQLSTY